MSEGWDAIVIGGGPAGCAVATTLRGWGRRVLLLERDQAPCAHGGESLTPGTWQVLNALGAGDRVRAARFVPKAGSTFVWHGGSARWSVYYGPAGEAEPALHIRRDELDTILLEQASASGVEVRRGCEVRWLLTTGDRVDGVVFTGPDGRERREAARWVVDAGGRDALVAQQLDSREPHPELAHTVVWAHWEGSGRLPAEDAGNTLCVEHPRGVAWHVPLGGPASLACVGVVLPASLLAPGAAGESAYRETIAGCGALAELLGAASPVGPVRVAPASAYRASRMAGPGWLLAGDAASFVDPIISPGVQTALHQGRLAATVVNTALDHPDLEAEATAFYHRCGRRDYDAFADAAVNVYESVGRRPAESPAAPPPAGAVPPGPGAQADGGARLAFLSLVSGLPVPLLLGALGEHMGRRQLAAARGGTTMTFGEEEGFAFLSRLFHRARLRQERAGRVSGDLEDGSVVRAAPGVTIGERLFLPAGGGRTLVRRRAVTNRFGDRFEASGELDVLLALLPRGLACGELARCLSEGLGADRGVGRDAFRDWLNLLADEALVEW